MHVGKSISKTDSFWLKNGVCILHYLPIAMLFEAIEHNFEE